MTALARLTLLGGFRLSRRDGRPIGVPRRKGAALLAFLACAPDGRATRDAAVSLLWPELAPEQSRRNLRQVLMNLRTSLMRARLPLLDAVGQDLVLKMRKLQVDVREFERLIELGTAESLRRAADVYHGDFLADSDVSTPAFDDWLARSRDRYRDHAANCLGKLLILFRERGEVEPAIQIGQRALVLDPAREEVHRALMEIYAAQGFHARALRQYCRCVESLRRELDVAPDRATTALYHRILGDRGQ